jgi:Nif-specific regulatory protein
MSGLSFYCVPLISEGAVIGTLSAERHTEKETRSSQMAQDTALLTKTAAIIADSASLRERIRRGTQVAETLEAPVKGHGEGAKTQHIIGTSSAMQEVLGLVAQVAPSDATVLITGESGTGKELIAAEIQRLSNRSGTAYIRVNCAALSEGLIESELFGHEKGAFTGALSQRRGRFELANGGTLFLDEIGEISAAVQVKLLRVLQEKELERVGGSQTVKTDVRLIAATNRRLEDEVKAGRFREDLYYRLAVFPIHLPPLRERAADIVLLSDHFAEIFAQKNRKEIKRISSPALELLTSYSWPGNVRELENCIERAVILSNDAVIHAYHLPPSLQTATSSKTEPISTLDAALARLEKEMIIEALKISGGNMAEASRSLGITERRMQLRVNHYGIAWRKYRVCTEK